MTGFAAVRRRPRPLLFLFAVLALCGIVAGINLPVALFPQIQFPRVVVSAEAGDRPVEQMELQVTRVLEQALRGVPGVRGVRSTTSRGSAEISVTFAWGTDMVDATLQAESAAAQAVPLLPPGTAFAARRMDPTVFPMLAYSLTSPSRDLVGLRDLAQYKLLPLLSAVDGVAAVAVLGGERAEYRVDVDPARLDAYGLSLDDVARALSAANVLSAVGRMEDRHQLFLIVSDTRFGSLDQIEHTVLSSGTNGLVELEDVATTYPTTAPQWQRVTADGRDAVLLQIHQQRDANSVRIAREVERRLADPSAQLPADVKLGKWYDQTELVTASARSVRDAIIIGVALAAAVLWMFLRNARITVIAVLAVPAVLAIAMLLLQVLGMSLNIMTLGGMAAAVGLIIDDVIVMLEQIVRRMTHGSGSVVERAMAAASEYAVPLAGSSACTVVVFLPLAFLSGVTGAFFKALSLTMAAALIISYLVSFLVVPLLAGRLLRQRDADSERLGSLARRLDRAYRRTLATLLRRPAWLLVALLPFLLLGYVAYRQVGSGFMPSMDEGGFILDYRARPGTALSDTDRLVRQVEGILQATPEVAHYSRRTGLQLGGGLTEANEGDMFIRLEPPPRRSTDQVMEAVRTRVEAEVPGLEIEMAQLMGDLIGDLTAVPQPVEVKLYSDDAARLRSAAIAVANVIGQIPGVVDVRDGINPAGDALVVEVDRVKAALEGIGVDALTQQLDALLSGLVTTEVQRGVKTIGLRVWIPPAARASVEQLGELRLRAPDGHLFPMRRVAQVRVLRGEPQITRENLRRMVPVTARISGRDLGSVIRDIRGALAKPGALPVDVPWQLGGIYEQQQIAFRGLIVVFVAAAALVFLVLLVLYQSFRVALVIVTGPLMAAAAVFIALWITGIELNISAMMGMTMILGIITEVAVFYFSELFQIDPSGRRVGALLQAGSLRLRPIVMTTLAAMLALLPLALGIGDGAQMQQPLAVAIVAGLAVQLPLVLMVLPVLYKHLVIGSSHSGSAGISD